MVLERNFSANRTLLKMENKLKLDVVGNGRKLMLNNVTFAHNTFVNTSFDLTSLVMSSTTTKDKKKSKKISFFNNLFSQFRFDVTQRKDFLNKLFEFEGNAFDASEAETELKKLKNLCVLNETLFRPSGGGGDLFYGLAKSLSSALGANKISVPFTLVDLVDMREDINQVVIGGERKGTRDIGCEQFVINANNKNGKKSNSSTIMSKISKLYPKKI